MVSVENSVEAIHEPAAPFDLKIGGSWPDVNDPATFLARVLGEHIPTEWLPASLEGVSEAPRSHPGRGPGVGDRGAVDGLLADEVPLAVFGYAANGALFGPTIGCLTFPPTGGVNLAALCPKG
jgi:hypothetical protein